MIVGALLAAGFLIAWLRFRPYLGSEGRYSDGVNTYDVSSAHEVRYAVWDLPQPFAGEVNTSEDERRPTLSPDGRHLVFAAGERGLGADLYIADMVEGRAVDVRPLAALNTGADEWAPCFSGCQPLRRRLSSPPARRACTCSGSDLAASDLARAAPYSRCRRRAGRATPRCVSACGNCSPTPDAL